MSHGAHLRLIPHLPPTRQGLRGARISPISVSSCPFSILCSASFLLSKMEVRLIHGAVWVSDAHHGAPTALAVALCRRLSALHPLTCSPVPHTPPAPAPPSLSLPSQNKHFVLCFPLLFCCLVVPLFCFLNTFILTRAPVRFSGKCHPQRPVPRKGFPALQQAATPFRDHINSVKILFPCLFFVYVSWHFLLFVQLR